MNKKINMRNKLAEPKWFSAGYAKFDVKKKLDVRNSTF